MVAGGMMSVMDEATHQEMIDEPSRDSRDPLHRESPPQKLVLAGMPVSPPIRQILAPRDQRRELPRSPLAQGLLRSDLPQL